MMTPEAQSTRSNSVGGDRAGLLRLALKLDAAATGALGVIALAAAPPLADLFGIPLVALRPGGLLLAAYAAAVWFGASRPTLSRPAAGRVVALNLLWVGGSVVVVATGWFPL